jgi:hypothetical protein
VGSRFSVSRSAKQPFALNAGRGASRLFSQALRLIGQALIQWRGLLLHGVVAARRYSTYETAGALLAFSSPMAAMGRSGDG